MITASFVCFVVSTLLLEDLLSWCYRLLAEITAQIEYDRRSSPPRYAQMTLRLLPNTSRTNAIQFDPEIQPNFRLHEPDDEPTHALIPAYIEMARHGIEDGSLLVFAARLAYPVSGVIVQIDSMRIDPTHSTWNTFRQAAILAIEDRLRQAEQDNVLVAVPEGDF